MVRPRKNSASRSSNAFRRRIYRRTRRSERRDEHRTISVINGNPVCLHRSLGIVLRSFFDSDSFFANEMESDAEQAVASVSMRDTLFLTSRRDASHSPVPASSLRNEARETRHGCVLVARDVRRDRKSVLVRPAPALAQRQAVGAAGVAASETRRLDVSWRGGSFACERYIKACFVPISAIPIRSSRTKGR